MARVHPYARKSSYRGKKKGRGRSVTEQLQMAAAWTADNGHELGDPYIDDDRSASTFRTKDREDFERLLEDIENGTIPRGDIVWAWQSSRLQRDLSVYVQIRDVCARAGVLWHYNDRTYDLSKREDRRASAYDAVNAEDQVAELSENVQRALRSNARLGRPHASSLYGYRRVYDVNTGDLVDVVPHEEQAPVVVDIFDRLKKQQSLHSIVAGLNEQGLTTSRSGKWTTARVRQMAVNPAYIGRRIHLGEDIGKAMWPPLVDEKTFYTVKGMLEDPARKTSRENSVKHLLTGIGQCPKCDEHVWAHPHHSGYRQYWCRENRCVATKADPVDDHVTALLVKRLARKDAARLFAVRGKRPANAQKLMDDVARWRSELDEGTKLVKSGKLSVVGLAALEAELLPEIEKAERKLRSTQAHPLLATLIRPTVEEVLAEWNDLELVQQRAVVRAAIEKLTIGSPGQGRRNVDPDEYVTIRWRGSKSPAAP